MKRFNAFQFVVFYTISIAIVPYSIYEHNIILFAISVLLSIVGFFFFADLLYRDFGGKK